MPLREFRDQELWEVLCASRPSQGQQPAEGPGDLQLALNTTLPQADPLGDAALTSGKGPPGAGSRVGRRDAFVGRLGSEFLVTWRRLLVGCVLLSSPAWKDGTRASKGKVEEERGSSTSSPFMGLRWKHSLSLDSFSKPAFTDGWMDG